MRTADDAMRRATDGAVGWTEKLYAGVGATDAAAFAGTFAEDGVFLWADEPPVRGPEGIEAFAGSFESIETLKHAVTGIWRVEGTEPGADGLTLEADVTYARQDGSTVIVPAVTGIERTGERRAAARPRRPRAALIPDRSRSWGRRGSGRGPRGAFPSYPVDPGRRRGAGTGTV